MTDQTSPLTEQQLDEYAVQAITADHEGKQIDPAVVTVLVDEVRRTQRQRRLLLASMARKDARSGDADRAVAEFLSGEPAEPVRRLEDGSTHTVEALTDAGEECVQHQCTAARQEDQLRQEQYTLRAAVEDLLGEVAGMADDELIEAKAAQELCARLRSALGLDSASV